MSSAVAGAAIRQASSFGSELETDGGREHYEAIRSLVTRVQVGDGEIAVTLRRQSLAERLSMPSDYSPNANAPLELTMPAELRRLGKEKRLIVAALVPKTNLDAMLIKAIVRAHQWFEMLKNRTVESISDLARIEKVQRTYPSRIIPLAFLAPDITAAILEGRQPIDLSLDRLLEAMPLPLAWDEQRAVLGQRIDREPRPHARADYRQEFEDLGLAGEHQRRK